MAPPTPGLLGSFFWSINWSINKPSDAKKGGLVLQHVDVTFEVEDKDGPVIHPADNATWDYWELWYVRPGFTKPIGGAPVDMVKENRQYLLDESTNNANSKEDRKAYLQMAKDFFPTYEKIVLKPGNLINDTFAITPAQKCTKGTIKFDGTAFYLDGLSKNDIPGSFQAGGTARYQTHSGGLPSISSLDPNSMAAVNNLKNAATSMSAPYLHNITVTWNAINATTVAQQRTVIGAHNPA